MRVFVNLSPSHGNRFSSLWLEHVGALAEVHPLALGSSFEPRDGDVIHLHWPDHYHPSAYGVVAVYRLTRFFVWLGLLRMKGVRVFLTIHNVAAHDRVLSRVDRWFWRLLPSFVDGTVVHASVGDEIVGRVWPRLTKLPMQAVKHPVYPREFRRADGTPDDGSRERQLIAAIGAMRPYKQVDQLVHAYRAAASERGLQAPLFLGGRLGAGMDEVRRSVEDMVTEGLKVRARWEELELEQLEQTIDESILVAVTHTPSVASGSMLQVLSLGGFLLAPDGPFTRELREDFRGHVSLYREPLDGDSLTLAATAFAAHECDPKVCKTPEAYTWSAVAAEHVTLYERLIRRPARHR